MTVGAPVKTVVLESGCCGAGKLEAATRQAVVKLGLDAEFEAISDLQTIMSYGVMSTPALVVNGEIRLAGHVPSVADIASVLYRSIS
jgi:small redox-active disulfide protein 2